MSAPRFSRCLASAKAFRALCAPPPPLRLSKCPLGSRTPRSLQVWPGNGYRRRSWYRRPAKVGALRDCLRAALAATKAPPLRRFGPPSLQQPENPTRPRTPSSRSANYPPITQSRSGSMLQSWPALTIPRVLAASGCSARLFVTTTTSSRSANTCTSSTSSSSRT